MGKAKIECKKLEFLTGSQKCAFCHTTEVDELKYGPIYMHKTLITHYFCLLLSSNMEQNGRDSDGILGFLPNDISKEVNRGKRLYCSFCKSGGATLGCAVPKCKVVFHLPCGLKHSTLHQFFGEFKSYCAKHRPVQTISEKILAESSKGAMCGICYEKVVPRPIHETLWAPCCQKSAFFHRDCVQKLAISAGYFFKCPLCNNTSTFQQAMKDFGIYIPEQDASWECVPHAYQDLLVRHETCDSNKCICPSGRKTDVQGTRWELILCKFCGSQGIHIGCGRLKWKCPEFACDICSKTPAVTEERNSRNYNGNRHRLSGTGRAAEIHPSVSADREGEESDSDTSVDSSHLTISNRRKKVKSPVVERRTQTPPPSKKIRTEKKSSINSVFDNITEPTKRLSNQSERSRKSASHSILIDDSDDDCEVLSNTQIKTNDGATIPVVFRHESVKKRLRMEGDVKVVPDEIVDITIQMSNVTKNNSSLPVKELIYSLPQPQPSTPQPQPSTSAAYSAPSTSFPGPDLGHFVLVDPTTLRPEDLTPGTILYKSVQPMVNIPQSQIQQPQLQPQMQTLQPQVQPQPHLPSSVPSNMPMQQLGTPGYADAKHSDLCEHRSGGCHHLHSKHIKSHSKKASRATKCDRTGRRGRRRRHNGSDYNRLNPRVVLTPLKWRVSDDGYVEILLPRKTLDPSSYHGSMKRKASPLPQRQLKKIKIIPKSLEKNPVMPDTSQIKQKRSKCTKLQPNKSENKSTQGFLYSDKNSCITNFFGPIKIKSKRGRKSKNVIDNGVVRKRTKKTDKEETKKLSSKNISSNNFSSSLIKKKRKYKKKIVCMLINGKYKTLDDFIKTTCDKGTNQLKFEEGLNELNEGNLKLRTVQSLVNEIVDTVLKSNETISSDLSSESFEENIENCDTYVDKSPNDNYSDLAGDSSIHDCNGLLTDSALIKPNNLKKCIDECDSSFEMEISSSSGGLVKDNLSLSEESVAHESAVSPGKPEDKIEIPPLEDRDTISCITLDTEKGNAILSLTKGNTSHVEEFMPQKTPVSPSRNECKIGKSLENHTNMSCNTLNIMNNIVDGLDLTKENTPFSKESMTPRFSVTPVKLAECKIDRPLGDSDNIIICKENHYNISVGDSLREINDASNSLPNIIKPNYTLGDEGRECEVLAKQPLIMLSSGKEKKCETSDVHKILSRSDPPLKVSNTSLINKRGKEIIGFFPKIKMLGYTKKKAKVLNSKSAKTSDKHPQIMSKYLKEDERKKADEIPVLNKEMSHRKGGKLAVNNLSLIDRYFITTKKCPVSTIVADEPFKNKIPNTSEEENRVTVESTNQNIGNGKRPLAELQLNAIYNLC